MSSEHMFSKDQNLYALTFFLLISIMEKVRFTQNHSLQDLSTFAHLNKRENRFGQYHAFY